MGIKLLKVTRRLIPQRRIGKVSGDTEIAERQELCVGVLLNVRFDLMGVLSAIRSRSVIRKLCLFLGYCPWGSHHAASSSKRTCSRGHKLSLADHAALRHGSI